MWGLDEFDEAYNSPECMSKQPLAAGCVLCQMFKFCYPAVRKPSVIQPDEDGELTFAALNTKSDTTHNE